MNIKKAKRLLLSFRLSVVSTAVLLLVCIGCWITGSVLREDAYTAFTGVSSATDAATRKEYFLRAISLCPDRPAAYLRLLDIYSEDGTFDKTESQEFLALYNSNHTKLNAAAEDYARLHYTAGFMYVNGYPDSDTTRLRMALPFLQTANERISPADDTKVTVACYCAIGEFYNSYIWNAGAVHEVSKTQMTDLLEDIEQTLAAFRSDTTGSAVFNRLGFCVAACNLLYSQRDILAVTVPEEQVTSILDTVYTELPDAAALQKEQSRVLLDTLLQNRDMYLEMIGRAYERQGVQNAD